MPVTRLGCAVSRPGHRDILRWAILLT